MRLLSRIIPSLPLQLVEENLHFSLLRDRTKYLLISGTSQLCVALIQKMDAEKMGFMLQGTLSSLHDMPAIDGSNSVLVSECITTAKSRNKKYVVPMVQSIEQRFTRSCLKNEGYRPKPILAVQPKIKKKCLELSCWW
jgi:hypothetical protein